MPLHRIGNCHVFDVPGNFVFFVVLLTIFTIKLHVTQLEVAREVREIGP